MARRLPTVLRVVLWPAGAAALLLGVSYGYVELEGASRLRTLATAPHAPVAIVFGAGLIRDGEPGNLLKRRLDTGIALYRAHKVEGLLLSGNSERHHDEVRAMRRYVLAQGVPEKDLLGDEEGLSTFDSCLRAREVYGIHEATLVTQRFHLPRALYMARSLGMDVTGVAADPNADVWASFSARELLARPLAVIDVLMNSPSR